MERSEKPNDVFQFFMEKFLIKNFLIIFDKK